MVSIHAQCLSAPLEVLILALTLWRLEEQKKRAGYAHGQQNTIWLCQTGSQCFPPVYTSNTRSFACKFYFPPSSVLVKADFSTQTRFRILVPVRILWCPLKFNRVQKSCENISELVHVSHSALLALLSACYTWLNCFTLLYLFNFIPIFLKIERFFF